VLKSLRVHPLQYLLTGSALVVFFLLLQLEQTAFLVGSLVMFAALAQGTQPGAAAQKS
jgi:inner membrane protein involved in colicin E2 resistance